MVDEYVTNPLDEDSDDEKKIYKTQSRAENKLKKDKLKRKTDVKTLYSYKKASVENQILATMSATYRPGRCHFCNERGQWKRNFQS